MPNLCTLQATQRQLFKMDLMFLSFSCAGGFTLKVRKTVCSSAAYYWLNIAQYKLEYVIIKINLDIFSYNYMTFLLKNYYVYYYLVFIQLFPGTFLFFAVQHYLSNFTGSQYLSM